MNGRIVLLIKNLLILGAGKFSGQLVALLLLPIFTTALAPEEFGLLDLSLTLIVLLAPLSTLQFEMAVFRYLLGSRGDIRKTQQYVTVGTVVVSFLMLLALLIGIVAGVMLQSTYAFHFAALLSCTSLQGFLLQVARGVGRNSVFAGACITQAVLLLGGVLLALYADSFDVLRYFENASLAAAGSALFCIFALRAWRYFRPRAFKLTRVWPMLAYSLPLVPNAIAWWATEASSRSIAALTLGLSAAGIYAAAARFPSVVSSLSAIFSLAWTESASLEIKSDDRNRFFSAVANKSLLLFSGIGTGLLAATPILFELFIGERFAAAYFLVPVLTLGAIANSMVTMYSGIFIAGLQTGKVATTTVVAAVISVGIALTTAPSLGAIGIALGTAIAFTAMALYRHFTVRSLVKITYSPLSLLITAVSLTATTTVYYVAPAAAVTLCGLACSAALTGAAVLPFKRK